MRGHKVEINGRVDRYFEAYDADHRAVFAQAHSEGRLCLLVGPTGVGKTLFMDFACASLWGHDHPIQTSIYGPEDVERAVAVALKMGPSERTAAAFYPKPET